jgi:hypothetical protein
MGIRDVKKALGYLVNSAGAEKVAKRFRVSQQTVRRWLRQGPPKERWKAVLATAQRHQDSEWREREKRDWSLEVLNRWAEAVMGEHQAFKDAFFLRQSRHPNPSLIGHAERLKERATMLRKMAWADVQSVRFRQSPIGKQFWLLYKRNIAPYNEVQPLLALERSQKPGHPDYPNRRQTQDRISNLYTHYRNQVLDLARKIELQGIPGIGTRQLMSLFFSG